MSGACVPDFYSDAINRSASVNSFDILLSFEAKSKLVQRSVWSTYLDDCPRLRLEETTMTVVDCDEPNTELNVQDASDRPEFPTASDRRTFETEPIFTAVSILAGAHLHCVVSSLKFTLLATDRLARTQVKLLGHGRLSDPHEFPTQLRTVVDEARGCLRDIAELASQEFHQLQNRLNELQETTRRLAPEANVSRGSYRRRWKAKL